MGIRDFFRRAFHKKRVTEDDNAKVPETVLDPEEADSAPNYETRETPSEPEDALETLEADEILEAEPPARLETFDLSDFWHDTKMSQRNFVSAPPDYRVIRETEQALGYKLPATYVELMRMHNGGLVNRCWYPLKTPAKHYEDYLQITGILGIGSEMPYSLCGRFGSRFLMESWGHNPDIGIAICNTIKPGRMLVFLDYRDCGPQGEPKVVYADRDTGEERAIANNFETFVRGLRASAASY